MMIHLKVFVGFKQFQFEKYLYYLLLFVAYQMLLLFVIFDFTTKTRSAK